MLEDRRLDGRTIPTHVKKRVDGRSRRKEDIGQVMPRNVIPCEACDTNAGPVLEYHHVRPFEHGGAHSPKNLVKLCPTCHAFVSRDHCQWAKWSRNGIYLLHVADRISLLADLQHEPPDQFTSTNERREEAWRWLEGLTGFTKDDLPPVACWGERARKDAVSLQRSEERYLRRLAKDPEAL